MGTTITENTTAKNLIKYYNLNYYTKKSEIRRS